MKYLLSFLLMIMLFGCSSPVARRVAGLGNKVTQCCASLSSPDKKPVSLSHNDEASSGGDDVSIFGIETKLIYHTW
ncbi:MAG: hypothetical protein V4557_17175 [Bacteroidota bacterium]